MRILQIFNLPSFFSARKSTWGILTALLLSLFLVGCGGNGGGGSFVSTPDTGGAGGNNVPTGGTGSVTFNFVQAQSSPIVVPTGTTKLRFEFFNAPGGDGNLVYRTTRDYASQVVIEDVPTTSRSVVVTAFGADGFPENQFSSNFTLAEDEDITVSATNGVLTDVELTELLASPETLSLGSGGTIRLTLTAVFSSGDRIPLTSDHLAEVNFSSDQTSIATVSNGIVQSVATGSTTIRAEFRGKTATVPTTVNTGPTAPPIATGLTITPATLPSLPVGSLSDALTITAEIQGSSDRAVTFADGLSYISNVSGVTVTDDLKIRVASSVTPGTTATLTFRYLGQNASITVTVVAKTLVSLSVTPMPVSIPFGEFSQSLTVTGTYSDGTSAELSPADLTFTETSNLFTVNASGTVTSVVSGTAGSGVLTISTIAPLDPVSLPVTVQVGSVYVRQLQVTPANLSLNPGQAQVFTVRALFSDDRLVDVTNSDTLEVSLGAGDAGAVLNGTRVVATIPGESRIINFTYPGTGLAGADVSVTATLVVVPVTLRSIEVTFAGNPIPANGVNLPRGYVGVFEITGTYSNNSKRRLDANEYRITEDRQTLSQLPGGNPDPNNSVQIFDDTYTIPPANPAAGLYNVQRQVSSSSIVSTMTTVATRAGFPAVVADWRRTERVTSTSAVEQNIVTNTNAGTGQSSTVGGNIGNFDLFKLEVLDSDGNVLPDFTRTNISVTVVDPQGFVAVAAGSGRYANRPEDPNLLIGTPREFEVRVNFLGSGATPGLNEVDPPTYSPPADPIPNFKLAEANLLFVNDIREGNPNLVAHRPTPLGLPALFVNNTVQVTNLEVVVAPVGGIGGRFINVAPPGEAPTYLYAYDSFGATSAIAPDGALRIIEYTYTPVDNAGAGFDIVVANVLTLNPITSPFNLPVGSGQFFRTIAVYGVGGDAIDVSEDYRPVVVSGEGEFVISEYNDTTGVVLVNGIALTSAATDVIVRALDVDNNQVPARGSSFRDSLGVTSTPKTEVQINVTPPVVTP